MFTQMGRIILKKFRLLVSEIPHRYCCVAVKSRLKLLLWHNDVDDGVYLRVLSVSLFGWLADHGNSIVTGGSADCKI